MPTPRAAASGGPGGPGDQVVYDPAADLRALLLQPWVLVGRLISISWQLLALAVVLAVRGNSSDAAEQQRLGKRILTTLTNLGPCFIKVGQALSTRPDLVRRDWLEQLTQLQDNLPPFDHRIALATIEAELGAPVDQLFEDFPTAPMAAASLGQVYRARPYGGTWVAVKVQRPDLERILRRDLVIIRLLAVTTAPLLPLNLGFGLGEIIDEFGRSLFEEIDYRQEAANAERFAALFADNPAVIVPRVDRLLSARRVLTTTWINGTKLQNRQELLAQRLDPTSLIRTGVIAGLQQLLEFGYFHADPHPGNLFALPGKTGALGHLAYVDFGMMDSLSNADRLSLTGAVVHLINRDFAGLAQDFVDLGFLNPKTNLTPIIPALEEVLGGALGDNVGSFNFKAITDRFSELMYAEMREKLLEVLFDADGRLQLERLENLLAVVDNDESGGADLLPVAGAGLKLLFGEGGRSLRERLLLTLVRDDRLNTDDLRGLMALLGRTFAPRRVASRLGERLLTRLNPLAA